ncbi:hypothetical protein TWF696_000332 [Orbilia brochopaga]|uniref:Carboxymuconolactone decarboxylase-like domain-containing protein n=1 Tax=Orbilia brochopaga TaxID=3140254 RepID=A0AAV9VE13_9PEZI
MVSKFLRISNQSVSSIPARFSNLIKNIISQSSHPQAIRPLLSSLNLNRNLSFQTFKLALASSEPTYPHPLSSTSAGIGVAPNINIAMASAPVLTANVPIVDAMQDRMDQPILQALDKAPRLPDRTLEETLALFRDLETSFPKSLGEDRWYLLALATLTYGDDAAQPAHLYTYLISQPAYSTPAARQALIRRLREALIKLISLQGICKPLAAIWKIAEIERDEDKDYSCTREGWQAGGESLERGMSWFGEVYRRHKDPINERFNAHKDFAWVVYNITYGLHLSDHTILDAIDTEILTMTGILIQNQIEPAAFHLRGARRIGISAADVEAMHVLTEKVAKFCRVRMDKTPRVASIEHQV